ncbi:MAG: NADH-quinone oxidoreductase subunit NuoK, partial [Chloroflexaceae bacterium]|nr:NADH-quinone oxidoreductase subunit NuoK [Chloroflexaceae bacterium]
MTEAIPLELVLIVAARCSVSGCSGALARRHAISILMGIELMLNAVNINLVAFWRYTEPEFVTGMIFALFVIVVAAAEATVGLAMALAIYREWETIN